MTPSKCGAFAAALILTALSTRAATADVTSFLNDLVSSDSPYAGFVGTWVNARSGPSDIDRVVVSVAGDKVRIQVFGHCENRVCNWGALPGRPRSDRPDSDAVRSLSADFNLGYALDHFTLHRLPGNALRFDLVTEFTDGSPRHDYESSGELVPAGTRIAAPSVAPPPVAPAPAAPPAAEAATAPPAPAGAPTAEAAAPPTAEVAPVAPAAPPPSRPWWDVFASDEPAATNVPAGLGDCITFNTKHSYVAPDAGNWKVRDFLHTVQDFGPYRVAAGRALAVINYYRLDEVCHIGHASSNLTYYRAAGEVPRFDMTGQDCVAIHPDKVEIVARGDDWMVVEGGRDLYDYGDDREGAAEAATVIKTYSLNRQCFFGRPDTTLSYWLGQ